MIFLPKEAEFLRAKFDRRMRCIEVMVTERCQMRCTCCFRSEVFSKSPRDSSIDVIDHVLSSIPNPKEWALSLTGGEPTIRLDLCEHALLRAKKLGFGVTRIVTNGMLEAANLKKLLSFSKLKLLSFLAVSASSSFGRIVNEKTQVTISAFEKRNVWTKVWIDSFEGEYIPYTYDPRMLVIRDNVAWGTGIAPKRDEEKEENQGKIGEASCSCRGLSVSVDGKVRPFCMNSSTSPCAEWVDIQDVPWNLITGKQRPLYRGPGVSDYAPNGSGYYCEHDLLGKDAAASIDVRSQILSSSS